MIRKVLLTLAAVVLAGVLASQVLSQTQTTPPAAGVIAVACTYQSNESNAAITSGRYGLAQCDNRGYLKVTPSGGGGGGGAVTLASGAVAAGAYASSSIGAGAFSPNSIAAGSATDGWDLTQGNRADAACATDTATCSVISLLKRIAQNLTTIATNVASSIPAGSAAIGDVGIYPRAARLSVSPISFSSAGDNTLLVRVTGTIKVYQLTLSCSAATTLTPKNAGTALSGPMLLSTLFLPFNSEPYYTTTGTNNFVMNVSPSGVNCGGTAYYLDN